MTDLFQTLVDIARPAEAAEELRQEWRDNRAEAIYEPQKSEGDQGYMESLRNLLWRACALLPHSDDAESIRREILDIRFPETKSGTDSDETFGEVRPSPLKALHDAMDGLLGALAMRVPVSAKREQEIIHDYGMIGWHAVKEAHKALRLADQL